MIPHHEVKSQPSYAPDSDMKIWHSLWVTITQHGSITLEHIVAIAPRLVSLEPAATFVRN